MDTAQINVKILVRRQYVKLLSRIQEAANYVALEEVQRSLDVITPLWQAAHCNHLLISVKLAIRRRASRLILQEKDEQLYRTERSGLYTVSQQYIHRLSSLVSSN